MIVKEYKQHIYKKKWNVTLLALALKDTIARTVLVTANIKIIEKSLNTFAVSV